MTHFHFTLGPVQGFVAQARRTRDFWAGSFLLSYLTAHAMKAVKNKSGKIVMPCIDNDKMLKKICDGTGTGPAIGSLPNCFEAEVLDDFNGIEVADAVQAEWLRIADAVWEHDKLVTASVDKSLWSDQIERFWDIAWVIAPSTEAAALAMRKNWRNHFPPEQAGDKCTMMGEWQELSGVAAPQPKVQKKFWDEVRSKGVSGSLLELRDGERLCAIAYVKRRFVHVWEELNPGWKLPTGVPSTSYMAAVHWLERLINAKPDTNALKSLCDEAKDAKVLGEKLVRIACISEALSKFHGSPSDIADIDGRLLFDKELRQLEESNKGTEGELTVNEIEPESARKIREARSKIVELAQKKDANFPAEPSPFYAILLMDGDNLGKTKAAMGDDGATKLSAALGNFTRKVPCIVEKNNGFLVYAGGDDVLALLPLEDALDCALELRAAYMDAFDTSIAASISAAVIYAHMKLPLTQALKDSHRLLDDVAKKKTGRDAMAVRIWKPGGATVTWAMRWGVKGANVISLIKLVKEFQKAEEDEQGQASKPLYRICERLKMLGGGSGFTEEQINKLMVAEYATSGVLNKKERKLDIAQKRIKDLMPLCKKNVGGYSADAAMLLRFLAQKGAER